MAIMPKRIIYTTEGNGVSICAPSRTALRYMTSGGGRWNGFPRGFLDRQIDAQAKYGVGERAAVAFVNAMQYGGLTTSEAYGVMRDRFCAHLGTACELIETENVSRDRWFRDAWRRSQNGGPVYVDLTEARRVQYKKLRIFARDIKMFLENDIDMSGFSFSFSWDDIREAIIQEKNLEIIRSIWPTTNKKLFPNIPNQLYLQFAQNKRRW